MRASLMRTPVLALVVGAACSGGVAKTAAEPRSCEPKELDAAWTAPAPVYRSCEVATPARQLGTPPRPDWTPPRPPQACNTALVEFVVDTLGVPEPMGARIVRATDSGLASALLASVPGRRYTPARTRDHAVRQVVRESYVLSVVTMTTVSTSGGQPARPVMPPRLRNGTNCRP